MKTLLALSLLLVASACVSNQEFDRDRQILDTVPENKVNDAAVKSVRTALDLMADTPLDEEMAQAKEKVAANPGDHTARFELAEALIAQGKNKDAADHLLTILEAKLDWEDGKAKAKLLEIFEAAGPKDAITVEGRRRLGSLMFS